ncbi:MAG: hypothetical protein PHD21_04095 [Flavobacteriales bacterium]|nr:hypothetical protein [Flavobacteriales bacterium]
MHEIGPFSIPAIRDFVPEKVKPWVMILFVIIIQLSGGVYLAAVGEMVGSLSLLQEDIMMAGCASMVGMALTFAIMFRLKFRFTSKTSLLTCCTAIIISNVICMNTHSIPVLVGTCFFAGFFRMWATFECNSTIQLWLTPKRDLSVFFCFIYLLVQGCIQISGMVTIYTAFFSMWEYMHLLIIGLLGCVMLLIILLFRTCRTLPKLPLYGIDWMGAILWAVTLLSIIFICVYGEHYDWFYSKNIKLVAGIGITSLCINLLRASFIRHPFIALDTWKYKIVYLTFLLYVVIDILLSPSHVLEHIYMESVLGYDSLNVISMNWVILASVVMGAFFTYQVFALRKWSYKIMTVIAFSCIVGYLVIFYFSIDYNLPKEALILPLFLRGFGYVIIAICFLTALSRVPFQHFFHAVSVQAFISAAFGSVLGTAVLGQWMKFLLKKNILLLSSSLDNVNPLANRIPMDGMYGVLQGQALMVTMKELYGYLALIGVFCILLFLFTQSDIRPQNVIHPTYMAIRRFVSIDLQSHFKRKNKKNGVVVK